MAEAIRMGRRGRARERKGDRGSGKTLQHSHSFSW
jgi:hypothetical protein